MFHSQATLLALSALLLTGTASATTVTLDVDFESPAFSAGPIGGNPQFAPGQGGWGGFSPGSISTDYAHSGTQSLASVLAGQFSSAGATKALNAAVDGEYPLLVSGSFSIGYAVDWWVQAWVRVTSDAGGARLSLGNSLGYCPGVQLSGTGGVSVNDCALGAPQANQGANILDQWILVRMVHAAGNQTLDLSILGPNVNFLSTVGYLGPNGSSDMQYIILSGDAYWDDVSAGTGLAPTLVPPPAAGWLLVSALATLAGGRRRSAGRA